MTQEHTYAAAGVDVAGEGAALAGLLGWVRKSHALRPKGTPGHLGVDVGYFASVLDLTPEIGLAVAADGVGTKLLVAQLADRYDTVGIDLVAMNVNDLVCVGAEPISILDYIAVEGLDPDMLEQIGRGLYAGAEQSGAAIAGGELAQIGAMLRGARPGKAFDLAAVALGVVHPGRVNLGAAVEPGDLVIGWASSGIHSNGLSLARRVLIDAEGAPGLDAPLPGGSGETVADALLEPTRIYVKAALEILRAEGVEVTALAHITGGGFQNMARIASSCGYVLDALPTPPPIFAALAAGGVPTKDLYEAYNMGVGMAVTVRPGGEEAALQAAKSRGWEAWVIGRATAEPGIRLPGVGLESSGEGGFKAC